MMPLLGTNDKVKALARSLGIDPDGVRRVIVDVRYDDVVKCYVERLTDEKTYDLVLDILGSGDVKVVEERPGPRASSITLNSSISELELSVRSRHCLGRMGITNIGELAGCSESQLINTKNFGKTSLSEVRHRLAKYGLSLRGSPLVPGIAGDNGPEPVVAPPSL